MEINQSWPEDADGDVFRRMQLNGFDFSKPVVIDFNVDFEHWPPVKEALEIIEKTFPHIKVFPPSENYKGYILGQLHDILTYEVVVRVQNYLTAALEPYGGYCDSWGVLH